MASANKQRDRELSTNWIASNPDQAFELIRSLQGEIRQKSKQLKEAKIERKHGQRSHHIARKQIK